MTFQNRLNIYTCEACGKHICTRDRDEGVTPMLTTCKVTPGCRGWMKSHFYCVDESMLTPTWEWYRPTVEQAAVLSPAVREHIRMGGLLLRKLEIPFPVESDEDPFPLDRIDNENRQRLRDNDPDLLREDRDERRRLEKEDPYND